MSSFQRAMAQHSLGASNNEIDYAAHRAYTERVERRFEKISEEAQAAARVSNVRKWDAEQVFPWNQARLNTLEDRAAAAAAARVIKSSETASSFYIKGGPGTGKTFLAKAIIRSYIGLGRLSPSQVYHFSEARQMANLMGGFRGREALNEIYNPAYKLYLVDNVGPMTPGGEPTVYDENGASFWENFMDHVVSHNLTVIFTSQLALYSFATALPGAAQSKLLKLVNGKVVEMTGVVAPTLEDDRSADEIARDREIDERDRAVESWGKGSYRKGSAAARVGRNRK